MTKANINWLTALAETPKGESETLIAYFQRFAKKYKLSPQYVRKHYYLYHHKRDVQQYKTDKITTDKKEIKFHWRDVIAPAKAMQELSHRAEGAQDRATWRITTDKPICVLTLADTQLGSFATDYDLFLRVTEDIIETDDLYVILMGDLLQMAIKLRGVKEAHDNLIPVKLQYYLLDSWLNDIKHKVIASTWDNHAVMREENQAGYSNYAEIFRRHTIYHNGIGHLDIGVNDITYKWAVSHFFSGKSMINNTHAPQRYMRQEAPYIDVAAQGDFHKPGFSKYWEGDKERVAIVCGSIQTNSGYAKRFFSLNTCPTYPCVSLAHDKKMITPFWSVAEWLNAKK